ncbi:ubiquinone biosynthesis protein COQ9, mitochondrial-like isoform X2 [Hibiscus syriacus]|uniref:ubiquinone biosynthesis protein COQ9, mitochondrial-like isoform X2 n=1 Tax=Hibiscus syriacus TaxID=106335 RepID=UPI0019244CF0|nr:ubiquinone biosynthesis protein COQ9, mitochondrial-like isoform X2 [Hibiscus syriacus]
MYRMAANRFLHHASLVKNSGGSSLLRFPILRTVITSSWFSTYADPQTFPNQTLHPSDSSTSSSSPTTAGDDPRQRRKNPRAEYEEEQDHIRFGWSEETMIAGAKEVGVSPSIVGSFPRKEAALVEFFMDDCLQRLIDRIDSGEELRQLIPSQRISKLVRIRLEMQAPYISKWPQALSFQAHPLNVPTSFKQRAMLVDEIWHAAGDEASDIDWYVKRTFLGGIYSATEIYMLTDRSPEFRDTWLFLDDRVKDAFDLKKTLQEATYLAEAVGAGMGSSLQGFVGKVFQR